MGFDQYHEPPEELSQEIRTFARMITSLIEEAEAISWYEQRMSVEKDKNAKAIMANAQKEEFKHFGMNLEFLLRKKTDWRTELQGILFTKGDIVKQGGGGREESRLGMSRWEALMEDKRRLRRTRVLKAGMISFGGMAISCTVRNLTKSGAMLDVVSPLGVPREFTLVISSDDVRHECRIVWVKERRMGVSFIQDRES